jgi:hypothetical protein
LDKGVRALSIHPGAYWSGICSSLLIAVIVRWIDSREIAGLKAHIAARDAQLDLARDQEKNVSAKLAETNSEFVQLRQQIETKERTEVILATAASTSKLMVETSVANAALGATLTPTGGTYGSLSFASNYIPPGQPLVASAGNYCGLRELFGRLGPHLSLTATQKNGHASIGTHNEGWEAIGDEVLKQLSSDRLHAIGVGYHNQIRRLNPAPIPTGFWLTAKFSYWFLDDDGEGILDAKNDENTQYSDIGVNRAEALAIWPIEPWPDFRKWDQRQEFELCEAACLWLNLEPRLPMTERALTKYKVWRSQIFSGGVPVSTESVRHAVGIGAHVDSAVTPHTKINREILITMAEHEDANFTESESRGVNSCRISFC